MGRSSHTQKWDVQAGLPLNTIPGPQDYCRFFQFVRHEPNGDHWLWTGGKDKKGYGLFWFAGRQIRAHRFAKQAWCGPLEPGHQAHHMAQCEIPDCVNPHHMQALDVNTHVIVTNRHTGFRGNQHCDGNGHSRKVVAALPVKPDDGIPF